MKYKVSLKAPIKYSNSVTRTVRVHATNMISAGMGALKKANKKWPWDKWKIVKVEKDG